MICRILTLLFVTSVSFSILTAQDAIRTYPDRDSFAAASRDLKSYDFEGIVPNSGFKHYQREGALSYAGMEFRPGGGARFGPGPVIVVGGWYQAGPAFETTSGAKLHWSPPNQPGNAFLEIKLGDGITAIATDVWTVQPSQSTIEVTVTTSDGQTRTETINTPARPMAGFIGFTSNSSIVSLRFMPPKGQTGLIIDNFTTGKSNGNRSGDRSHSSRPENVRPPSDRPTTAIIPPPQTLPADPNPKVNAPAETSFGPTGAGVIAYVRGGAEIRLIKPDGSNDRQLWTHPDLSEKLGIFELAWKRDGTELAFSSPHEATSSIYMTDLYSIRPDGSNLRRLTNAPDRGGLGPFPKGSVTVEISNVLPESVTPATFIVYVAGASEPQQVLIPAGASKGVTFKSVADFGRMPQAMVAMSGNMRWVVPGVDVIPGRNVTAPPFPILHKGFVMHGAFRPVWRADGSRVSFGNGVCLLSSAPANPQPGVLAFNPIFAGKNPMGTCAWDWGPTPATADQIIYSENSSGSDIYQITEGRAHPGTKLTAFSDLPYQMLIDLRWIPDGSGFLYSTVNTFRDSSNIFQYDFATKRTAQVTSLTKRFATLFSISPDSRSVVFENCPDREAAAGCEVWTVGVDGSGARMLVKDGLRPAWGK